MITGHEAAWTSRRPSASSRVISKIRQPVSLAKSARRLYRCFSENRTRIVDERTSGHSLGAFIFFRPLLVYAGAAAPPRKRQTNSDRKPRAGSVGRSPRTPGRIVHQRRTNFAGLARHGGRREQPQSQRRCVTKGIWRRAVGQSIYSDDQR